jgi:hypothetical protein
LVNNAVIAAKGADMDIADIIILAATREWDKEAVMAGL